MMNSHLHSSNNHGRAGFYWVYFKHTIKETVIGSSYRSVIRETRALTVLNVNKKNTSSISDILIFAYKLQVSSRFNLLRFLLKCLKITVGLEAPCLQCCQFLSVCYREECLVSQMYSLIISF